MNSWIETDINVIVDVILWRHTMETRSMSSLSAMADGTPVSPVSPLIFLPGSVFALFSLVSLILLTFLLIYHSRLLVTTAEFCWHIFGPAPVHWKKKITSWLYIDKQFNFYTLYLQTFCFWINTYLKSIAPFLSLSMLFTSCSVWLSVRITSNFCREEKAPSHLYIESLKAH